MAAITLTPVDISTAPVVVNSDIIYHVFTIGGVTRVFFSKGGKSPYQVDVQESAASIAALSPNLVEVTTVNGAEYLFIGSGGAGTGLGIMFIETDTNGSKITFKYHEESGTTTIYSSDSPSVITARINALSAGSTFFNVVIPISSAQALTMASNPITILGPPPLGYVTAITSGIVKYDFVTTAYDPYSWCIGPTTLAGTVYQALIFDTTIGNGSSVIANVWPALATTVTTYVVDDEVSLWSAYDSSQGDGTFTIYLTYQYIQL